MFKMDETMLVYLGFAVSVLTFFFNYWQRKSGKKFSKKAMAWLMYIIAFAVVVLFGSYSLPAFPSAPVFPDAPAEFMSVLIAYSGMILLYLSRLLALLTAIVSAAWVPYQFIYKRVFEGIKPLPEIPAQKKE